MLSLDDLVAHPDDGDDTVSVVFDDGFLNQRDAVESLLASGLPVTLFVVSGHVGGTNAWGGRADAGIPALPLLDWDDLEHLIARGASIGAHTRRHPVLTRLPDAALDDELSGHLDNLAARLGIRPAHIAYPYGSVDDAVATRAAAHFRWGHTTDFRLLTGADAALRLPRLDMYYFQMPGAIESWGTPAFNRRVAWCRARRLARARLLGGWSPR